MAKPIILLVDDVNLILEIEKSFLRHSAVRIMTARNGEEALEAIRAERPALIYMDLNMPKMDGCDCCRALKADANLCSIPVIMVTTAGKQEDEEMCRRAGCDDYLTKPIDRRIFLDKGRRFLPDIDRREHRVPCRAQVTFSDAAATASGLSADLSVGGIFIASDQHLPDNAPVTVSFTLPDSSARTIQAQGRVAWRNGQDGQRRYPLPNGFGVEFTDLDDEARRFIKAFVDGTELKG